MTVGRWLGSPRVNGKAHDYCQRSPEGELLNEEYTAFCLESIPQEWAHLRLIVHLAGSPLSELIPTQACCYLSYGTALAVQHEPLRLHASAAVFCTEMSTPEPREWCFDGPGESSGGRAMMVSCVTH